MNDVDRPPYWPYASAQARREADEHAKRQAKARARSPRLMWPLTVVVLIATVTAGYLIGWPA
jgi:hypothetical protein